MSRLTLSALAAAAALGLAAETPAAPLELVILAGDRLTRVELRAEVDGRPVSAVWDETFARVFAFCDRDGNGLLDAREAAAVPSPLALRRAMASGFTPPIGTAPSPAVLDQNGDGRVTADDLAAFYRASGLGNVLIGVGRLPAGVALTDALLKRLDTNGDGRVTEGEWRAAADTLKALDRNDDELIGAGELVPGMVYPGAAGTTLLSPLKAGAAIQDVLADFPLVVLPADEKDAQGAAEIVRRNGTFNVADLLAWRTREPDAHWVIRLGEAPAGRGRLAVTAGRLRLDGWTTEGTLKEAVSSARRTLTASFGQALAEPAAGGGGSRRRNADLSWLTPLADRNGNGRLDREEFDAWLALQEQIARGQVLLTILDAGTGLFEVLDTDHNGALSVRELRAAWDRVREAGCVTDGALDRAKQPRVLLAAVSRGYPRTFGVDLRSGPAWFRAMDRNGDGDVSRREFTGPADVFERLDADRDGLLTAAEAERAGSR